MRYARLVPRHPTARRLRHALPLSSKRMTSGPPNTWMRLAFIVIVIRANHGYSTMLI